MKIRKCNLEIKKNHLNDHSDNKYSLKQPPERNQRFGQPKHQQERNDLMMPKLPNVTLSLKQFMLRRQVLGLYREIFKAIREVPDEPSKKELREWARRDFRNNKNITDETAVKMCMQYGRRCLKELQTSLGLSKS